MQVPPFLVRRFYVERSLRNTPTGFAMEAHNPIAEATLVGVGRIAIDGHEIERDAITAVRESTGERIRAGDLSPERPIRVQRGDRVTLEVEGERLEPGKHRLEIELHEQNMGIISFGMTEELREPDEGAH